LPIAKPGARWTREEEAELVTEIQACTDLAAIAEHHGRRQGGIRARLIMMIPDDENVPEGEEIAWITARLADPGFDWRAQLDRVLDDRAATRDSRGVSSTTRVSDPDAVLAIWQQISDSELSGQRKAGFLAHPALDDLVAFTADVIAECGHRIHDVGGQLLLDAWAAECAAPGLTGLPSASVVVESLRRISETVRMLVATVLGALPDEAARTLLQRRLGLRDGRPETLQQIATELGVSRERIRQRQERAVQAIAGAGVLPGHKSARSQARDRLANLAITRGDGTTERNYVRAVAELGFPEADRALAARVIARAIGRSLRSLDGSRDMDENG
jgi:hypothetical protein